jgi:DNA-binding PucR family transcriptional regulator
MSLHVLNGVDAVVIERVSGPFVTRNPHVHQYLIDAHVQGRPVLHEQYETVNMWQATLCQQYTGKPVSVVWRRSPYGKNLLSVALVAREQHV